MKVMRIRCAACDERESVKVTDYLERFVAMPQGWRAVVGNYFGRYAKLARGPRLKDWTVCPVCASELMK